jgi:DNA invertase Pin-like site-specific DNA recombinase
MAMMSSMPEGERLRIIERTHEGRQIARTKHIRMGRQPKLTPPKRCGVSVSTISRLAS